MRELAWRRAWRAALALVLLYAAYCAALMAVEPSLVFPGAGPANVNPPPGDATTLRLTHPDGAITDLWLRAPAGAGPHPVALVLHGNGDRIDRDAAGTMRWMNELGYVAALAEYRGYGNSTGTPSQETVTEDLVRVVDRLRERPEVDPSRIVYFGTSLGTCFAAQLAARRPPHAMVLRTPFLRTDEKALEYFAPPLLVRNSFRADRALDGYEGPVLLLKHLRDRIAPPEHSDALAVLLPQAELVEIDATHNGPHDPAERARENAAVEAFLSRVRSDPR